jgi:hypothetical protein
VLVELTEKEKKVLAKCLVKMQQGAQRAVGTGLVSVAADRRHGGSRVSWQGV